MRDYLEGMVLDTYPDQVEIKTEESSGNEEEEDECHEEDLDHKHKEKSNSCSSALTTMDWGLRSHVDYQEDYWIGDCGASSHMVRDRIFLQRHPFKERSMQAMEHQCPWFVEVR